MPAEVFFAHSENASTLTVTQLAEGLKRVGLSARLTEDKTGQLWIEFGGSESRLLTERPEPLGLVTLQVYGDIEQETSLIEKVEALLRSHGFVDAEQFPE